QDGTGSLPSHQLFHLAQQRRQIPELPVYRGEAHIGHLVDGPQGLHNALADLPASDLGVPPLADLPLDVVHHLLQHRQWDRPLFAGLEEPVQKLLALKRLPAAILFNDHQRRLLPPLVGGEAASAALALAPAADGRAFVGSPRIQHLAVAMVAVRAAHPGPSFRLPLYTLERKERRGGAWTRRSGLVRPQRGTERGFGARGGLAELGI